MFKKTISSSLNSLFHTKPSPFFKNFESLHNAYSLNFFSTKGKGSKQSHQNQSKSNNPYGGNPRTSSPNPKKSELKSSSASHLQSNKASVKTGSVKDMLKGSPAAQSENLTNKQSRGGKNIPGTDTKPMDPQDVKAALLRESLRKARIEEENEEAENFKLDMPWDFRNQITKQPEGNLKSPVGVGKLLSYPVAMGLFKDFVQAMEEYDVERFEELLECTFYERVSKNLRRMKNKGYTFELEGMSSKKSKVDLFKVTNIYGVGIFTNRKMNDGANQYSIFENTIEGSPTQNYVKRKMIGGETAVVKVILDLIIETPIKVKLFDKDGISVESVDEQEINYHHMRIENDVFEADYDALQQGAKNEGELKEDELSAFKNIFSHGGWKIIDMDNYMGGNPIVQAKVILG